MNEIKLISFYSLYRNYFLIKNVIFFIYFENIFYHVTLKNIFRILNNSVYFQDIVVRNEPLILKEFENHLSVVEIKKTGFV